MKVLLIDAHPLILSALRTVIQSLGDHVNVATADSARAARDTLRQDPSHDLVLLDLQLGGTKRNVVIFEQSMRFVSASER